MSWQDAWVTVGMVLALVVFGLVMGLWIRYGRGDDGVEYPRERLADRKGTARRIDPGVNAAMEIFEIKAGMEFFEK